MDAKVWLIISIVGYSLAGALFIVTCILFFKMRILAIIGDLSGRTAVKQIQEIREQNALSGQKRHHPSAFNLERGSLTEPVEGRTGRRGQTGMALNQKSKRLEEQGQTAMELTQRSNKIEERGQTMTEQDYKLSGTEMQTSNETEVLGDWGTVVLVDEGTEILDQATEVLIDEEIEGLNQATEVLFNENTEVLTDSYGTTVLNPTGELVKEKIDEPMVEFKMVKDIKVIHTDEVI